MSRAIAIRLAAHALELAETAPSDTLRAMWRRQARYWADWAGAI